MGQTHLYCLLRGIPLPIPGSLEYHLIEEGINRERAERLALVKLGCLLLSEIGGLDKEKVKYLLTDYVEELYQYRYNYKYESVRIQDQRVALEKKLDDLKILKKVAHMSDKEPDSGGRHRI